MYVVLFWFPVLVSVSFGGFVVDTEDVVDGLDVETYVTDVELGAGIKDEVACFEFVDMVLDWSAECIVIVDGTRRKELDRVSFADGSNFDTVVAAVWITVSELTIEGRTEITEFGCLMVVDSDVVTADLVLLPW